MKLKQWVETFRLEEIEIVYQETVLMEKKQRKKTSFKFELIKKSQTVFSFFSDKEQLLRKGLYKSNSDARSKTKWANKWLVIDHD